MLEDDEPSPFAPPSEEATTAADDALLRVVDDLWTDDGRFATKAVVTVVAENVHNTTRRRSVHKTARDEIIFFFMVLYSLAVFLITKL
jgi:hypothetical protein